MKKQIRAKLLAIIFTIALVVILLSQINFNDFIGMLANIKIIYLILAFMLYATSYLFRAMRFHILLKRDISIKDLFSIVSIHNMALSIFPARSGELSYIYMLKKRHDKNVGEGGATLFAARMFDVISLSFLFFVSAMLTHNLPEIMKKAIPISAILLFLVILILLMFMYECDRFVTRLRNIFTYLNLNELLFIKYIFRKLDEMTLCFERIHHTELLMSLLISAMLWVTLYSANYLLVVGMGIDLPIEAVFLASTFFFMASILPIQGIGGFGTLEGSWAVSFIAVGVTKEAAISSGFLAHFFSLFCLLVLFFIGLLLKPKKLE